jgi:tetratricopeptide (TPR) repeat protein
MVTASNEIKTSANAQFGAQDYTSAIGTYDKAVAELPTYLDYELAVLQSNIAACHIKLEQWKEALDACQRGLDGLERELPTKKKKTKKDDVETTREDKSPAQETQNSSRRKSKQQEAPDPEAKIIELPSDASDDDIATHLANLDISATRRADITRIRLKLLLRRARARSSLTPPSWSHLAGALEDYTTLSSPAYISQLPSADQKTVRRALVELPPRVDEAKQREVGEMMGKLKDLGNGILKPFGLSTDMFKMVQDPGTGGWSMSFDQGGGKKEGG